MIVWGPLGKRSALVAGAVTIGMWVGRLGGPSITQTVSFTVSMAQKQSSEALVAQRQNFDAEF